MVYRYGWLAGVASIAFALWRLSRLLEPTRTGTRWQVVVLAALFIGTLVTLAAVRYRLKAGWIALLNLALFMVAAGSYAAPDTGYWILPGPETLSTLWAEVERAGSLIRHGVEPVQPIAGLVIVLAALFWALGALLAFGLQRERPFVALIPPLVVGLQLLTIERQPSSNVEIAIFVLLVAGTTLAVGLDERDRGAGRMARPGHQPPPRSWTPLSGTAFILVVVTVVAAVGVSGALAGRIPTDGVMTWRAPGSLTAGLYGSVSYEPFVEIQRGLVSRTGRPLFTARLAGDVAPDDVYYRLVTLDTYEGGKWYASEGPLVPADRQRWENDGYAYAGDIEAVTATMTIQALRQDFLPVPYAVRGVDGVDADSFRIRTSDASVHYGPRTYNGMEYQIEADVPLTDSNAVATNAEGGLSPLFLIAAAEESNVPDPDPSTVHRTLPDAVDYLQLPEEIDTRIEATARDLVSGLGTDFEKGLALEYWFRENGGFTYSLDVDVDQGHGPDVMAAFLFDTDSTGYRTGYCEQFATSMGVMARTLGIPTRVVLGFLPGQLRDDGEVLVTDISGHAWVELWIPSQGWMRFDPTPRGDGLNPNAAFQNLNDELGFDIGAYLDQVAETSPGQEAPADDPTAQPEQFTEGEPGLPIPAPGAETGAELSVALTILLVIALLAALVLGGIPVLKWTRRRARMRRLTRGDIGAAWEEIVARLADLERPIDPAATPSEVASDVDTALQPLADLYSKAVYGPEGDMSAGELDVAGRSMTLTAERLNDDLSPLDRVRATYRLASVIRTRRISRWLLPWLRP